MRISDWSSDVCASDLLAGRLVDAARAVARRHFRQGLAIEDKADDSPVTRADREAETAMREIIAAAHPDHGIHGEEFGVHNPGAEFVWVLDPIDGTKRFITGNPLFGSLVRSEKHTAELQSLM